MAKTVLVALIAGSVALTTMSGRDGPAATSRAAASRRVLVEFPKGMSSIESWMEAEGWQSKRNDPAAWGVGNSILHMVSRGDSVLIGKEFDEPIDVRKWPRVRMRIRIGRNPAGMDLSRKKGDDAALRVYLAFGRSRNPFRAPPTMAYTWTEKLEVGTHVTSAHDNNLHYICIGLGVPETKPGEWITVERDLIADYEKAFDWKPTAKTKLTAILLKCDSNDTGTSAEAWLENVELLSKDR